MMMTLQQAAKAIAGQYHGPDGLGFDSVCHDTRSIEAGALYVAIKGENFDGHGFIKEAKAKGAVAALVEGRVDEDIPQIVVQDTRLALGKLAEAWRLSLDLLVVGITGSNGKTTVKEMVASILGQVGNVFATKGNLNNEIGVPLTLLSLRPEHHFAVVEMGANHPGEISYLTQLVHPNVAVVNNAGRAHLEGFGSLEGVAKAKGEIYSGLTNPGMAIVNNDDAFADYWHQLVFDKDGIGFGMENPAEVTATWQGDAFGSELKITTLEGEIDCHLQLPGEHNVRNALAAASCATALGIAPEAIAAGLNAMQPVKGRLQRCAAVNGAQLIDDTYNANPASYQAALDVLASCEGEHFLALGDMAELGSDKEQLHSEMGAAAKAAKVDRLFTVGPLSRLAAKSFGDQAESFDEHQAMIASLQDALHSGVTLLVKGSRSSHMERVVEVLSVEESR